MEKNTFCAFFWASDDFVVPHFDLSNFPWVALVANRPADSPSLEKYSAMGAWQSLKAASESQCDLKDRDASKCVANAIRCHVNGIQCI